MFSTLVEEIKGSERIIIDGFMGAKLEITDKEFKWKSFTYETDGNIHAAYQGTRYMILPFDAELISDDNNSIIFEYAKPQQHTRRGDEEKRLVDMLIVKKTKMNEIVAIFIDAYTEMQMAHTCERITDNTYRVTKFTNRNTQVKKTEIQYAIGYDVNNITMHDVNNNVNSMLLIKNRTTHVLIKGVSDVKALELCHHL